ncbi:guanine nucleotide binding protein, alpha subunit [Flagelloscypha sp. PMI_526]|nr:guanine nucleotide binding protein, alpha subunit [Flagelloscypha sp. PMI_526]
MRIAGQQVELLARPEVVSASPQKESERVARARSAEVERLLDEEHRSTRREVTILILGGSGAGKSTLVKQMRIHYGGSYNLAERESFKSTILSNFVRATVSVIAALHEMGLQLSPENELRAQTIVTMGDSSNIPCSYKFDEVSAAMVWIFEEPVFKQAMSQISKFDLEDSAFYFLQSADRITSAGYLPTEEDILRCHEKTTSITETSIPIGRVVYKLCDAPSNSTIRSKRNKWNSYLQMVTALIFVIALSDYDQKLEDDQSVNRLDEAMELFESISTSPLLNKTHSILVFLNKMDIFEEKLPHSPLNAHFPDYTGENEANEAMNYFLKRFVKSANPEIYVHRTNLMETSNSVRVVPLAVEDTILRRNIKTIKSL